jgi:predicted  nucleic acid-binding Zn-ribbon protein
MSTTKRVFAKLSAQEPMKVEFSLVSELNARVQETKQKVNSLRDAEVKLLNIFDEAARLAKDLDAEYGSALSLTKVITNAIDRTEVSAKELGLDVNSIKEIKDVKAAEQDLLTAITKAKNTINAYQSLR